jgi:hypothetical protein
VRAMSDYAGASGYDIPVAGAGHITVSDVYQTVEGGDISGVPDPGWKYTDKAGHQHFYVEVETGKNYPSLDQMFGQVTFCDDCQEAHCDVWLECRVCGEKIEPGTRPAPPAKVLVRRELSYQGVIPKDIGVQILKWSESLVPDPGTYVINGKLPSQFLEEDL